MINVVIADDHAIVRQGLRALLEQEPDLAVVGEADDGPAALELVHNLSPDILVLDIAMPSLSGVEVAEKVKRDSAKTKVVILSMYANEAYFLSALRNNVDSYILKSETGITLVQAIREVINGRRYLSPVLTERAINAYVKANSDELDAKMLYERLTPREREVLRLVAEGYTNISVASQLSISQRTVETHRANLMRKLGLTCQADLVRFAVRCGALSTN